MCLKGFGIHLATVPTLHCRVSGCWAIWEFDDDQSWLWWRGLRPAGLMKAWLRFPVGTSKACRCRRVVDHKKQHPFYIFDPKLHTGRRSKPEIGPERKPRIRPFLGALRRFVPTQRSEGQGDLRGTGSFGTNQCLPLRPSKVNKV